MSDKKYFAKHLPVEGEIKATGKIKLFREGKLTEVWLDNQEKLDKFFQFEGYKKGLYVPAKLFICSRDIQVGDKVKSGCAINSMGAHAGSVYSTIDGKYQLVVIKDRDFVIKSTDHKGAEPYNNNINYLTEEGIVLTPYSTYKVIGEISPEATWVKEGMEFNFEDFQFAIYPPDHEKAYEVGSVRVKCPCCGIVV